MDWNRKDIEKLNVLWPDHTQRQCGRILRRTRSAVKQRAVILGLRKRNRKEWTKSADRELRRLYPDLPNKVIAERLGCTLSSVNGHASKLGLKKSEEYIRSMAMHQKFIEEGKKHRIKKGQILFRPPKGVHYSPGTEFKKGNVPANVGKNGEIRVRAGDHYGTRPWRAYKWIRIRQGHWRMLHVVLWEKHRGRIPKGKIITFKNGNSMDVRISNLRCITRAEHALNCQKLDGYIAARMSVLKGVGKGGKIDRVLMKRILANPKLIEAKRRELELRRIMRERANAA